MAEIEPSNLVAVASIGVTQKFPPLPNTAGRQVFKQGSELSNLREWSEWVDSLSTCHFERHGKISVVSETGCESEFAGTNGVKDRRPQTIVADLRGLPIQPHRLMFLQPVAASRKPEKGWE